MLKKQTKTEPHKIPENNNTKPREKHLHELNRVGDYGHSA